MPALVSHAGSWGVGTPFRITAPGKFSKGPLFL